MQTVVSAAPLKATVVSAAPLKATMVSTTPLKATVLSAAPLKAIGISVHLAQHPAHPVQHPTQHLACITLAHTISTVYKKVKCANCTREFRDKKGYYHFCVYPDCQAKLCPAIFCENSKMIGDNEYYCVKHVPQQ